jgi:hypothetical protein
MKLTQKLRKSAAPACLVALFVCSMFRAQYAQAQDKVSDSPELKAQASEPSAPAQDLRSLHRAWAKTMHRTHPPKAGCFHTSYPSTQWQEVPCAPPPAYRSGRPRKLDERGGRGEVGGTTTGTYSNDIVAQAPTGAFFSYVVGSFPTVNGVTNETGVSLYNNAQGVPQGLVGGNEYTLQLNTNISHTAACGSYSYCTAWQQYVMATNVYLPNGNLSNQTEVFIEDWLYDYGNDAQWPHPGGPDICPAGFTDAGPDNKGPGDDCELNSAATPVDWDAFGTGQLPITDLADPDLYLSGSATPNETDWATLTYNGQAYSAPAFDSYTDISSVWNQAEFNVVGNYGGAEAQFNDGTAITVEIEVTDNSTSLPQCAVNSGSTGESNNLNFVPSTASPQCCQYGPTDASIQFMEVYDTNHAHTASCGISSITGEPHITTVNDIYYNFQAAGEFIALLDTDGTEIQTRQTPIPTLAPGDYDPSGLNNDGLFSCLAMNTAVAARVGKHRVTYEPSFSAAYGQGSFDLRIDGKVTALGAAGVSLGDDAQVKNSAAGGGIEVDFPDGKILTAIPSGSYDSMQFLNVQFERTGFLSDGEGAAESGIAGAVPKGSWLPALPTGASLGAMPATLHERYATLYSTFGNAWRVTSKNTLFDYARGASTATFTDTKWPVENATTCTIPNQKVLKPVSAVVAEEACKPVSNATLHASCLFDVQATGDTGFADTYVASESAHKILSVKPIDLRLLVPEAK